jgi:prepilin-type N-terminal cleavage/methylation domain-containing protein
MKKGFSLIELMVIIIIIGILAAVTIPKFIEAKKQVKAITELQNLGYSKENAEHLVKNLRETMVHAGVWAPFEDMSIKDIVYRVKGTTKELSQPLKHKDSLSLTNEEIIKLKELAKEKTYPEFPQ